MIWMILGITVSYIVLSPFFKAAIRKGCNLEDKT